MYGGVYNYGRPITGGLSVKPPSLKLLGWVCVLFIVTTVVFAWLYFAKCDTGSILPFTNNKSKGESSTKSGREESDDLPVSENADIDLEDDEDFMPRGKNFNFNSDPNAMSSQIQLPICGPPPPAGNMVGPPPPIKVGRETTDNRYDYNEPDTGSHNTTTGPRAAGGARRKGVSIRL